ncbi:MAG: hypothetical protein S4CHLAM20_04530 [Chlamydiia bacterium]|nr:hypothetical protein [Chlamydiia bacterium]
MFGTEIIYLSKEPSNRREKREMEKELKGVWGRLTEVETKFMEDLFNPEFESAGVTYQDLYNHYILQYKSICEWIKHNKKHKWILINKNYIVDNYKPVEYNYDREDGECSFLSMIRLAKFPFGWNPAKIQMIDL